MIQSCFGFEGVEGRGQHVLSGILSSPRGSTAKGAMDNSDESYFQTWNDVVFFTL